MRLCPATCSQACGAGARRQVCGSCWCAGTGSADRKACGCSPPAPRPGDRGWRPRCWTATTTCSTSTSRRSAPDSRPGWSRMPRRSSACARTAGTTPAVPNAGVRSRPSSAAPTPRRRGRSPPGRRPVRGQPARARCRSRLWPGHPGGRSRDRRRPPRRPDHPRPPPWPGGVHDAGTGRRARRTTRARRVGGRRAPPGLMGRGPRAVRLGRRPARGG